jgi:hypothetical protein
MQTARGNTKHNNPSFCPSFKAGMSTRKRNPFNLILRLHADQYLLLMLISFAGSVSVTRLSLYLTGYPQLGVGELHIAHVLWGGLILFTATLFSLIFANRLIRFWSAILSGVGVGLFIDEVGKFITSTNDYFYPAAAPIIYVFFLLSVLVYLSIRKRRRPDPAAELYALMQQLEEIIDGSFTEDERQKMIKRIQHLQNRVHGKELLSLCDSILKFLNNPEYVLPEEKAASWEKLWNKYKGFERKFLTHRRSRVLLSLGFLILAGWLIIIPTRYIIVPPDFTHMQALMVNLFGPHLADSSTELLGFQGLILLQVITSFAAFLTAAILILRGQKFALRLGFITLVFTLTLVNLITFYFSQFSTIFEAFFQTILLVALLRYRYRFGHLSRSSKEHG